MLSAQSWSTVDLHIHSLYSDGANRISAILDHVARKTELDMIAITDHDTIEGALEAREMAPRYGIGVIVGQEITTRDGHLLGLFLQDRVPAGLSIVESVVAVHEQGGVAILAHPFDRIVPSPGTRGRKASLSEWFSYGLDGLEALNGSQVDAMSNPRAAVWAQLMDVASTGGSDAHHKEVIGTAFTRFPGTTADDLKQALFSGACLPGGHRWTTRNYMGWFVRAFVPRTWRSVWHITPAYSD